MSPSVAARTLLLLLPLALAACGGSRQVAPQEYNDPRFKGAALGTYTADKPFFQFGKDSSTQSGTAGTGLNVNAYLWRGALDTLAFMPLASEDAYGGVIITDWFAPSPSAGERFKATAYILGRQLRADGVKVSVFRQVQQGGQWVDAPVDASTATALENKILARARELRAQSAGG